LEQPQQCCGVSRGRGGANDAGATVESVVAVAKRLNPTVAAASLEFDAAIHKIGTAGVLADPTLILEAWDVNGKASDSAASATTCAMRSITMRVALEFCGIASSQRDIAL